MYKLCFFVPQASVTEVKEACFTAGGGKMGDYDRCAWEVLGTGQFRPLAGSAPYLGQQGRVERVPEYRVEMVCADAVIDEVVAALRQAHPYESPAFDVVKVEDF